MFTSPFFPSPAEMLSLGIWRNVRAVMPVTDYLLFRLTGAMGHDAGMAQSQGRVGDAARAVEERFGSPLPRQNVPGAL